MEKTYKILKVIIVILSLIALLLAADLLYDRLKDKVALGGLATAAVPETPETTEAYDEPDAEQTQAATDLRELMPDFTVYDSQGNAHRLSDFRGKPVILNFWASWCGPCKREMPDFDEKYGVYGDQIHFLMVNLTDGSQETFESGSAYIREQGFAFPVYYDLDFSGAMAYGVMSIPVTYFVDSEGYYVASYPGAMSADVLQEGINLLLPQE